MATSVSLPAMYQHRLIFSVGADSSEIMGFHDRSRSERTVWPPFWTARERRPWAYGLGLYQIWSGELLRMCGQGRGVGRFGGHVYSFESGPLGADRTRGLEKAGDGGGREIRSRTGAAFVGRAWVRERIS